MNYILNTKTKKIEIYWDNQNEYQGLINFLSQYPITEENSPHIVKREAYSPNTITWANNSYSTSTADVVRAIEGTTCTDSLSSTITLSNDAVKTSSDEGLITTALETVIQPKEDKPKYWLNNNYQCPSDVSCIDQFIANKAEAALEVLEKVNNTSLRS